MTRIETALAATPPPMEEHAPARAAARLVARAQEEGLVDVAYGFTDSPVGRLLLATTPRGLLRVAYDYHAEEEVLEQIAERVSPRVLRADGPLEDARRELDEYFGGSRREFGLAIDWSLTGGFRQRVLERTARIPYGAVATYTDMAVGAGSPRAVRAAGTALATNPVPVIVPCHRVLRTGGGLGGYTGGLDRKRTLLELEQRRS